MKPAVMTLRVYLSEDERERWDGRIEYREENDGAGMCNTGWGQENNFANVCGLGGIGCNVDHVWILRQNLREARRDRGGHTMSDKAIPDITEGELPEWLIRAVARSCSKKEARGIADSSARAHIRLVLLTEGAKSFRELANQEARRVAREEIASMVGLIMRRLQDDAMLFNLKPGAHPNEIADMAHGCTLDMLQSIMGELLRDFGGTDTEPGEEAP